MNSFGLAGLFSSISFSALAIVVLIHDFKSKLNIRFVMFLLGVAWWTWGVYKIVQAGSAQEAVFWWRISHIGVILIPIVFLHFVYVLLELPKKTLVYISYCVGALFLIVDTTPYFIVSMRLVFDSFYYISSPGLMYSLFVAFFAVLVIYGHALLFIFYRKSVGMRKKQIFNIFLGGLIGFLGGLLHSYPSFVLIYILLSERL
ncbi:MAG: histidine kinase N-terminal 7TM domain-containing protein [bacterium]